VWSYSIGGQVILDKRKTLLFLVLFITAAVGAFAQTKPSILQSRSVLSVAALREANAGAATDAMAITAGYYAANDGGGGTYFWSSASTAADNGGTIIAPTGVATGRWILDNPSPTILQFGAVGDARDASGTLQTSVATNNRTAIANAVAAGGNIVFPKGSYWIGNFIATQPIWFDVPADTHITAYGAELVASSSATLRGYIFNCEDVSNVSIAGLRYTDISSIAVDGLAHNVLINLDAPTVDSTGFSFKDISAYRAHALLRCYNATYETATNTTRVSRIHFDNGFAEDCEYGFVFAGTGDDFTGSVTTDNVVRSYFVHGIKNHNVTVNSYRHRKFSDILIKSYFPAIPTDNIYLVYNCIDNLSEWPNDLLISFENQAPNNDGRIRNIHIWPSFKGGSYIPTLGFRSFTYAGVKSVGECGAVFDNINIYSPTPMNRGDDTYKPLSLVFSAFFTKPNTIIWHGPMSVRAAFGNALQDASYVPTRNVSLGGFKILTAPNEYLSYQLSSGTAFVEHPEFNLANVGYPFGTPFADTLGYRTPVQVETSYISNLGSPDSAAVSQHTQTDLMFLRMASSTLYLDPASTAYSLSSGTAPIITYVASGSILRVNVVATPTANLGVVTSRLRLLTTY